jgi:hypothetical protein
MLLWVDPTLPCLLDPWLLQFSSGRRFLSIILAITNAHLILEWIIAPIIEDILSKLHGRFSSWTAF